MPSSSSMTVSALTSRMSVRAAAFVSRMHLIGLPNGVCASLRTQSSQVGSSSLSTIVMMMDYGRLTLTTLDASSVRLSARTLAASVSAKVPTSTTTTPMVRSLQSSCATWMTSALATAALMSAVAMALMTMMKRRRVAPVANTIRIRYK